MMVYELIKLSKYVQTDNIFWYHSETTVLMDNPTTTDPAP